MYGLVAPNENEVTRNRAVRKELMRVDTGNGEDTKRRLAVLEAITATSPTKKAPRISERWEAKLDRIPAPLSAALIALLTLAIGWADYSTAVTCRLNLNRTKA